MQIDDIMKIASNYINTEKLDNFHKDLQDYYSSIQIHKAPHKTYDRGLLDFLKDSHIQCVNSQVSWKKPFKYQHSHYWMMVLFQMIM